MTLRARAWMLAAAGVLVAAGALAGCKDHASASAGPERFDAPLTFDIRTTGALHLEERPAERGSADLTLTVGQGFDLFDVGAPLAAPARIEAFPEAGLRMYTAHFSVPGRPGGPCEGRGLALELALTRRLENARLSGALTVYCPDAVARAAPIRVLRVASR